jgi:hypothetical protein
MGNVSILALCTSTAARPAAERRGCARRIAATAAPQEPVATSGLERGRPAARGIAGEKLESFH